MINRLYKRFFRGRRDEAFLGNIQELMSNVMNGHLVALYSVVESVSKYTEFSCSVVTPWVSHFPNYLAMAVPKDSPYAESFRSKLLTYKEKGIFRHDDRL